ncbi:TPA: hypothetical protein IVD44_002974, partial [Enterococcus faecium]|nr:hypothetical protein [Enterococcus faecium]
GQPCTGFFTDLFEAKQSADKEHQANNLTDSHKRTAGASGTIANGFNHIEEGICHCGVGQQHHGKQQ